MPSIARSALSFGLFLSGICWIAPTVAAQQPAPRPAAEATRHMRLPDGFEVTLFAGEPDIVQPIAMSFDGRGRLWVVECLAYPQWSTNGTGNDRVTILEDTDGDERFDQRKLFLDHGSNLTSIELGFGGVWLCSAPNLLFIPDRNHDDVPDGPPEVLLDGFVIGNVKHNIVNGLAWGPDGWLYGCHGIQDLSRVGKPGASEAERTAINCCIWRYHPTDKTFEQVCSGGTNPWGVDWNDYGQAFATNCVINHLMQVIPGGHFERMYGQDLNPHVYGLLPLCSDHRHWTGGKWTDARGGEAHDASGGGHAHSGCSVYLGDHFPAEYRNSIFMCNIHGFRLNRDHAELQGSAYVGKHDPDFLLANDEWFRGVCVKYGPDGALYASDWSDNGECHDYVHIDRSNGRIYKVIYKPAVAEAQAGVKPAWKTLLGQVSSAAQASHQASSNEWVVRHARRLLQEQAQQGPIGDETKKILRDQFAAATSTVPQKLRALWALYAIGAADQPWLVELLKHEEPWVRLWAVRLAVDKKSATEETQAALVKLAASEPAPVVRLALASALQRLPTKARADLGEALAARADNAEDTHLPLMIWYGIEPLPPIEPARVVQMLGTSKIPLVRQNIVRRLVQQDDATLTVTLPPLIDWLRDKPEPQQRDLLHGMLSAWTGRRRVPMPANWPEVRKSAAIQQNRGLNWLALRLGGLFGEEESLSQLLVMVLTRDAPVEQRNEALTALIEARYAPLLPNLKQLLKERTMRGAAIRAYAAFDDADTPLRLLVNYDELEADERTDAIATLATRVRYATELLQAVESNRVPKGDVSLAVVRQMKAFRKPELDASIEKIWGQLRPPAKDKAEQMARLKQQLTPEVLAQANLPHGRELFAKNCSNCHKLFDAGKKIGPELTGAQRKNLEYVLENMIDPSAAVGRDYQMTQVQLSDGRLLTGIVVGENDQTLTLQTSNDRLSLTKSDIELRERSPLSMMPEGVLKSLSEQDIRDLVAYLGSPAQVPLPEDVEPVADGATPAQDK